LRDAALDDRGAEFLGPLCQFALDFVVEQSALFPGDADMVNLAVLAVRGIGSSAYSPSSSALWQAFLSFPDNVIRYEVLAALPRLGSSAAVEEINRFLAEQNSLYGFAPPDTGILNGVIKTLSETGDERSYAALFSAYLVYPGESGDNAALALFSINGRIGGLDLFLTQLVLQNPVREKLEAMRLGRHPLAKIDYRALAEAALESALNQNNSGEWERQLRGEALRVIREEKITRALPLVVKNYTQCLSVYRARPNEGRGDYLEAVDTLAAMESVEGARLLALQLALVNSSREQPRSGIDGIGDTGDTGDIYNIGDDEEVVLALVNGLARLAYKEAYDHLNRMLALSYSDTIKAASREALSRLQW
ncbi:MAG: hypothetical protein LBJ31_09785, partial [Treponema sp.]|nr:hypothetical protein [Treponema sp.]